MARRNQQVAEADKRKIDKEGIRKLRRIFSYMLPYKWKFIAGLVFLSLSSSLLIMIPAILGELVDAAQGGTTWLPEDVNQIALVLFGVLAAVSIASYFRIVLFAQVNQPAIAQLRQDLFGKFTRLPIAFYDKNRTGALISRLTADVSTLQDTFSITLAELLRQALILIIGIAYLFISNAYLTQFMLLTFPVIIIAALFFGKFIRKLSKQTQDYLAETNTVAEEALQSIHSVKAFANEAHETERYSRSMYKTVNAALKAATYRGGFVSFIIFALMGGIILVLWQGAVQVQSGALTSGGLLSFLTTTMFIGGSIAGLGDLFGSLQRAIGSSERVLDILDEAEEPSGQSEGAMPTAIEHLAFEHVGFAYPSRKEKTVLSDISFELRKGQNLALVGQSGAGKSTVVQLVMRFYDALSGQIRVNGQNIQSLDLVAYRSKIGTVPQEVILFGGTIRENIAYGKPGASEAEIREAARQAHALEFIEQFPDQMDTLVGERGIKLSGGQRQRIAIARAILKNPDLLILDEATNALDSESEHLVQMALENLMKGRTTIVIAHRLATIRKADQIIVLEQGQIAEQGSHEQLMEAAGSYANFVKMQQFDLTAPTPQS